MISVIIPAYNVVEYVSLCLDSILNQTFIDVEIIVVDDGSKDDTLKVLKEYSQKHPQIKVIQQENSGQSIARNRGIREAKGDFIVFVDSDDWLPSVDVLERLHNVIKSTNSDYVQGGMSFIQNDIVSKTYLPGRTDIIEENKILDASIKVEGLFTGPVAKIYRTDFIKKNELFFLEGLVNEDTAHSILIAAYALKVGFLNESVYAIRESSGSTSRADFRRMLSTMHQVMRRTRDKLIELGKYDSVKEIFEARYLRSMLYNLFQSAQRTPFLSFKKDWEYCMSETDYKSNGRFAKHLRLPHRVFYYLSKYPRVFFSTFRILNKFGIKMH